MEPTILALFNVLVWIFTILGIITVGFWIFEVLVLRSKLDTDRIYDEKDIQVRIMSVDNEKVVQRSINTLPMGFDDIHVISETSMDIEGGTVHVVPDDFECNAVRKGRAMEWAMRNITTDREFLLYLDEDSHLNTFPGLPDRDIVQLRERPQQTDSLVAYLADILRVGLRLEQLAFSRLSIPLFAWGGGLAIRKTIEDEVTWDRESIVEDTLFLWKAATETDASYAVTDIYIQNQSPPSIRDLLNQRRRWAGGNHRDSLDLPQPYRTLSRLRNYAWALTPLTTFLLPIIIFLKPVNLYAQTSLHIIGLCLLSIIPIWYGLGLMHYPNTAFRFLTLPLAPLAALIHGLGGLWGIVHPPQNFKITPKTLDFSSQNSKTWFSLPKSITKYERD